MIIGGIFFCGLLLAVIGAPTDRDAEAKILSYENTSDGKGNYKFSFETSNGIYREESGAVIHEGQTDQRIDVRGFVSFTDPDGNIQRVNYIVDEKGYQILPPIMQVVFAIPPNAVATLLG